MQPTFLPWLGYFALMDYVDLFIYLDDAQISPNSFMTRNRIPDKSDSFTWLMIEESKVRTLQKRFLNDTNIINAMSSYIDISKKLYNRYNHDSLEKFIPFLKNNLSNSNTVAQINISLIQFLCQEIGISPKVTCASGLNSTGKKSRKVLSILNNFEWSTYVVVPGAVEYMKSDEIWSGYEDRLKVFNFTPTSYRQKGVEEFIPYMSAIDALFEVGGNDTLLKLREGNLGLSNWA